MFLSKHPSEQQLRDAEVFRTVRRVAREDVRATLAIAPDHSAVRAAATALDQATTIEDLFRLEPLAEAARSVCGVAADDHREVRIGDRILPRGSVSSYRAVAEAAKETADDEVRGHRERSPHISLDGARDVADGHLATGGGPMG